MLFGALKAAHIISVIAWMAGLFYLPRLFVYHADAAAGSDKSETFKIMERRLLKAIMLPAAIASWAFGLAVAWAASLWGYFGEAWFLAKVALVLALTGYHMALAVYARRFAQDANDHTARFYRVINEVPTALMILIVILVVMRPF